MNFTLAVIGNAVWQTVVALWNYETHTDDITRRELSNPEAVFDGTFEADTAELDARTSRTESADLARWDDDGGAYSPYWN